MQRVHDSSTEPSDRCDTATAPMWPDVVEAIYRNHFDELCRTAMRYLDTQHAAEETVQESFSRLAALKRLPEPGCELSYVRSIVLNEARSVLRRRRTMLMRLRTMRPLAYDTTVESALALDGARNVDEHLSVLSTRQRQVVELRHLVGLSERETAAALAISPGSVKTHSSRGLASIRDRIGEVA